MTEERKILQNRTVVYKTLFGSKLYGTDTPTSDLDWKEIYLPSIDNMLIGKRISNIVDNTKKSTEKRRNTADDVDYEYIPVQQFAIDFVNGQTYALEIAFSVLNKNDHASQTHFTDWFYDFVSELSANFLTNNIKKMSGYAYNQAQIYGIKGSRLSTVIKFIEYISESIESGKISLQDKLEVVIPWVTDNSDKYLFNSTYKNHDLDFPCIDMLGKIYPAGIFVWEALSRATEQREKYGNRANDAAVAKGIDWKATAHAVRIVGEAIELLETGMIKFPFSQDKIDHLLSIKHGEVSDIAVSSELSNLFDIMDDTKLTTKLPEYSNGLYEEFEKWLKLQMVQIYSKIT